MFARDVGELFLLPYVEAWRTGRLRGDSAAILGRVLSANGSVALDALLARGCHEPSNAVKDLLDGMIARAHPRGFFWEPGDRARAERAARTDAESEFVDVTATYARYLLAFDAPQHDVVLRAFDWLVGWQDSDGAWRPAKGATWDETASYLRTRRVAAAFAELPANSLKRFGAARRKLAAAWADRILEHCECPDAVLTNVNIARDPRGPQPTHPGQGPDLPPALRDRVLYFPLEDLWLALKIGASPSHPHLEPWINWLAEMQLADGSWRLGNPGLRERLLLSDPNGRLRAEALYLTDEWITLRGAQILRLASRSSARMPDGVVT